jgi:hypothetical protein
MCLSVCVCGTVYVHVFRVSACLQGFYPIRPCECVSTGILDFNNYVLNWYDSTR